VTLKPGKYRLVCTIANHDNLGQYTPSWWSAGARPQRLSRRPRGVACGAVSADACVGIVANPASGRDIRRLVAGPRCSATPTRRVVFRLLAGLGAAGVERVLMLPAGDGLSPTLRRQLDRRTGDAPFPALEGSTSG
jgi:hypothetical protein